MNQVVQLPNMRDLVDPLLGAPYAQYPCWQLVRHLIQAGFGLDIVAEPVKAAEQLTEIWWEDDPRDPLTLVQPWDLFIMVRHGIISEHVGLVIDSEFLVHPRRKPGVVIEPLIRWRPMLLQLGRLRALEGTL